MDPSVLTRKAFTFLLSQLLLLSICLTSFLSPAQGSSKPTMATDVFLLMEYSTGQVLYSSREHDRVPPASLTKLMSVYTLYKIMEQNSYSWQKPIPITTAVKRSYGATANLSVGEVLPLRDLYYAMLLPSANDASVALAEALAGSEDAFAKQMTINAQALGMENSSFLNASGLPIREAGLSHQHYMSAYDTALLSRQLLHEYPQILTVTSMKTAPFRDGARRLNNTNRLLEAYAGLDGLKTGFTSAAGYCFVGTAERQGLRLIAVVMGTKSVQERERATQRLLDYGFQNYYIANLWDIFTEEDLFYEQGSPSPLPVKIDKTVFFVAKKGEEHNYKPHIEWQFPSSLPILENQQLGYLSISYEGAKIVDNIPVLSKEELKNPFLPPFFPHLVPTFYGL
ncbi:D-alanyl-D-alanine carboxypeptidase [Heliorestis acidaminivorans]|uniref:serine-type D-Ala-D-Ala carboxypeptidase n=1 Tax=Heliorestis acidaminivorans TaxID=553427 RepID=A0A6I0ESD7_9FIRM|nr:D-alanyl-D-alanine carboxypeptidase family protein [Heliorestis acidaminivorans]KAB2953420.1 D-alanyl-D-alanine carboxypeptidase [Heliorestis acidaminivorans]